MILFSLIPEIHVHRIKYFISSGYQSLQKPNNVFF
jgi:hypothetical protein